MEKNEEEGFAEPDAIEAEEVEFIPNDDMAGPEFDDESAIAAEPPFTSPAPPSGEFSEPQDGFTQFIKTLPPDAASASIVVQRFPDHMAGLQKLRTPCQQRTPMGSFPWNNQSRDEIRQFMQNTEGGGFYHFQIRIAEGLTQYKWRETILDPPGPTVKEQTVLDLAEAKRLANGGEARRTEANSQPSQPAPPPPQRSLLEQMKEIKDNYELVYGKPPAPELPAETYRPPLKDQIAQQVLESIVKSADEGDAGAKRILTEIAMESLGLNKAKPEPAEGTLTGAVADYVSHPEKIEEAANVIFSIFEKFMPLPQPKQQTGAAPNISNFRRAPAAPPKKAMPAEKPAAANSAGPASPDLKLVETPAPESEPPPAATAAPTKRVKMVKW